MKKRIGSISGRALHRPDLADRVSNVIRKAIFEQRLKPGDPIRETQLSQELNISRTPLREAFRSLEQQGLIVRRPFHGVYVASIGEEEARKVYRIRAVLESMAFKEARSRINDSDCVALRQYINAMKSAARKRDLSEFNRNDMAFHTYIWTLSGDEVLEKLLNDLSRRHFVVYNIQVLALLSRQELMNLMAGHRELLRILKDNKSDPFGPIQSLHQRWVEHLSEKLYRKRTSKRR